MSEGVGTSTAVPAGRRGLARALGGNPLRMLRLLVSRWLGTGAQFLLNVALGRVLGAEGLGVFYLFQAWYRWLAQVGALGLPVNTLRVVSVLEGAGDHAGSRRYLRCAFGLSLLAAVVIAALILPFAPELAERTLGSAELAHVLRAAVVAGALWIALRMFAAAFKAYSRAELGLMFEYSALPVGLLAFLGVCALRDLPVSSDTLIAANLVVLALALGAAALLLLVGRTPRDEAPARPLRDLFRPRTLAPLWGVGLVNAFISNAPLLLMPQFASAAEIALFGVSARLVALSGAIQDALISDFSPRFARHHDAGDGAALRAAFRQSRWLSILTYAPFLAFFLVVPQLVLGIFGDEFREGVRFLYVVALGQAVSSASGLVGGFLGMTNRQDALLRINLGSLVFMLVAIVGLGSWLGAIGVAWAYALTLAVRNLSGLWAVRAVIAETQRTGAA